MDKRHHICFEETELLKLVSLGESKARMAKGEIVQIDEGVERANYA